MAYLIGSPGFEVNVKFLERWLLMYMFSSLFFFKYQPVSLFYYTTVKSCLSFRLYCILYYNCYVITSCDCACLSSQVVCIPHKRCWTFSHTLKFNLDLQTSLDKITSRQPFICKVRKEDRLKICNIG